MANKQLFPSKPGRLPPETDAYNEAGGRAYRLSDSAALAHTRHAYHPALRR
ncbi:MAG: hypothetical protein IPL99_00780 [Candidatus Competibacteraceae bacterium]|nr:hypothetical protein [Candidatus Competibacteraceae bacterium]